jgi:hypothetical protein
MIAAVAGQLMLGLLPLDPESELTYVASAYKASLNPYQTGAFHSKNFNYHCA